MTPFSCKLRFLKTVLFLNFTDFEEIDRTAKFQMELYCLWHEQFLHFQGPHTTMEGYHVRTLAKYIEDRIPPFTIWSKDKDDYEFTMWGDFMFYIQPTYKLLKNLVEEETEETLKSITLWVSDGDLHPNTISMGISDSVSVSALRQFASVLHSIALWLEGKLDEATMFESPLIEPM
jgi:hypothetical protein